MAVGVLPKVVFVASLIFFVLLGCGIFFFVFDARPFARNSKGYDSAAIKCKKEFSCPKNETIHPCICYSEFDQETDEWTSTVDCSGPEVTQDVINSLFTTLRNVHAHSCSSAGQNKVNPKNPGLEFDTMVIERTLLKKLDLTPFLKVKLRLKNLQIQQNPNLALMIAPPTLCSKRSLIRVENLQIYESALTDQGLGDVLSYFAPHNMHRLSISASKIQGSLRKLSEKENKDTNENETEIIPEFLPGLSKFKNLTYLHLMSNQITTCHSSQFKENKKLRVLNLSENNMTTFTLSSADFPDFSNSPAPTPVIIMDVENMTEVNISYSSSDSSFLSSTSSPVTVDVFKLMINLGENQLGNDGFLYEDKNGTESQGKNKDADEKGKTRQIPIYLDLQANDISLLKMEKFRTFLKSNVHNRLNLDHNLLMCKNKQMIWIHDKFYDNDNSTMAIKMTSQILNGFCRNGGSISLQAI